MSFLSIFTRSGFNFNEISMTQPAVLAKLKHAVHEHLNQHIWRSCFCQRIIKRNTNQQMSSFSLITTMARNFAN